MRDAAMPMTPGFQPLPATTMAFSSAMSGVPKLLLRRLADRALNLAPLCVEQVELEREAVGLRAVLRRQECNARARRLDAPCRDRPWREQKPR